MPDTANKGTDLLIKKTGIVELDLLLNGGIPSGHVVHYVVFFGFLLTVMIVDKKIPWFCRIIIGVSSVVLILTISISRIYLGAHWATDVFGAYLFGIFYLGILLTFYLKIPEGGPKLIQK